MRFRNPLRRSLAKAARAVEPAHRSFCLFERWQYRGAKSPFLVVNSDMVRRHMESWHGVAP